MAADNSNGSTEIYWNSSYTIGIIVGSVLITIIFTGFAYLTLKYMKKKFSQSEYYVDEEKDGHESYIENTDVISPDPHLHQIQPILTISEVVSSVKQALEVLGDTVIPHRWSTPQQKTDLSI